MRNIDGKEMNAVLKLDGPGRFTHFIKQVVDRERAWGLWSDGWALMAQDDGTSVFPLWPAKEYAKLCAVEDWAGYEPSEIGLDELLAELAPKLKARGVRAGIFPTPTGKGIVIDVDELCGALKEELGRYE